MAIIKCPSPQTVLLAGMRVIISLEETSVTIFTASGELRLAMKLKRWAKKRLLEKMNLRHVSGWIRAQNKPAFDAIDEFNDCETIEDFEDALERVKGG